MIPSETLAYYTQLFFRVCVFGTLCLIVGSIVMGTAQSLGAAIAAQAVGGIGAGICELTAIAGVAEISPQRCQNHLGIISNETFANHTHNF